MHFFDTGDERINRFTKTASLVRGCLWRVRLRENTISRPIVDGQFSARRHSWNSRAEVAITESNCSQPLLATYREWVASVKRRRIRQTNRNLVASSLPKTGVSVTFVAICRWEGPVIGDEMVTPYETQASVRSMVSRDARPFCRDNRRTPLALGEDINGRQWYSSQHRNTDVVNRQIFP